MTINPENHLKPLDYTDNHSDDVYWGLSCLTVSSLRVWLSRGSLPLSVTELFKQSEDSSVCVQRERERERRREKGLAASGVDEQK